MLRVAVVSGFVAVGLAACGSVVDDGTTTITGDAASLPAESGYTGPRPDDNYAEALSTIAQISGEATGLPDLISDPPVPRTVQDILFAGHQIRVVRFDGYVTNQGPGVLDMFGDPTLSDPTDLTSHSVWQRVWNGTDWEKVQQPPVRFESADGHDHFHLMEIARYSLWDSQKRAEVAPGEKVGFCLFDSEQFRANQLPAYLVQDGYFCRQGAPLARVLRMGISPGWRDLYAWDLPLQWVDVSNVVPGEYFLGAESDPFDQVLEADETNNGLAFARTPMVIAGFNALPSAVEITGPETAIDLDYETIGSPIGGPEFRITRLPNNGELQVEGQTLGLGDVFTSAQLVYSLGSGPHIGTGVTDGFEFEVIETGLMFPLFPQQAAVSLGGPETTSVALGGHRGTIYGETMAQIIATDAVARWSVEGIDGGDSAVGTIDRDGLYVAPDVDSERTITISAQTAREVVSIELNVVPRPNRLPHIEDPIRYIETGLHEGPIGGPIVERVAVEQLPAGEATAFMVPVLDADGEPVTVEADGLPPGLELDPFSAVVAGIPTEPGTYSVTVTGDDGNGTNSHTFDLEIVG